MDPKHEQAARQLVSQLTDGAVSWLHDPIALTPRAHRKLAREPGLAAGSLGLARARAGQCPGCLQDLKLQEPDSENEPPVLVCPQCNWDSTIFPSHMQPYLPTTGP